MGALLGLAGGKFFQYLGGFLIVGVVLIIIFSLIGGISYTYDTSDRSRGGISLNFHFGDGIRRLRELRQERGRLLGESEPQPQKESPQDQGTNPKFDIPNSGRTPWFRPLKRFDRLFWRMRTEPPAEAL